MADIETKDPGAEARHRSDIYGLLATIYRQEITSDLLGQIKDPQFLGALSVLEVEGIDGLMQKPAAELLEDLAVEYTRLFLGPGKHISPHESVHHQREDGQWGMLWGASTVEAKKFIEATGLSYTDDYKGMPDHISVEFEFMQQLTLREEQAWKAADAARAGACRQVEKKFIEEHLIRWVPAFCEMVIQEAELPFYQAVAILTRSFIEFEMKEMNRNGDGVSS
ncbi:MAG: molecular chaperone TorD family protein [Candidatus Desulfatibia sp.]|uniref:TorD/DmsD family molecular chaperone n=1 Tax=Candidatus Desulfatibia sp. TaxID=3101189 RepID=UPI002F31070E